MDLVPVGRCSRNEFVFGATVWALRFAGISDIQKDSWMRVPTWSFIRWTVQRKIFAVHHHNICFTHMISQ